MSRPSRDNAVPVALFPFLAVLLCTMGALVVVMIALSRAGAENARREAAHRLAPKVDENAQKLAEIRKFQAEVAKAREEVDAKLKAEIERVAAIEASIRRQQEKLEKLKLAVQELVLMEQEHYDDREQAERELARLQQLIAASEKSLEELQSQQASAKKSFAILPHVGAGGTSRRPLYFECVGDKIILQPEGIELVEADFLPPWGLGSPLAVAIRTATEYYRASPRSATDTEGAPYPLIIVRPSGVEIHSAALAVLNSYEGDFGYQAAPHDWKLAYPDANPELASRIQNAVDIARQRREVLAQAAPIAFGPGFGGGPSGGRSGGTEGPGLSGDYTTGGLGSEGDPAIDPEERFFSEELNTASQQANSGSGSGQSGAAAGAAQGFSAPYRSQTPAFGTTVANPYAGLAAATSAAEASSGEANSIGAAGGPKSNGSVDGTSAAGSASANSGAAQQSPTAQASAGNSGGAEGNLSMPSPTDPQQQMSASSPAKSKDAQVDAAAAKRAESVWEPKRPDDVAVRRRGQVIVRDDQLAILSDETPPSGVSYWTANSQTVVLDQPTPAHVPAFIEAMRKHVTGWGFAGDGLFWRPVVYLNIAPGGEQRAQELAALLKNSGLEMQIASPTNAPQTAKESTGGSYAPR
jgi:hypothetical protein